MATLREQFATEIQSKVGTALGITNVHAIPRLTKVVINVGLGEIKGNEPLQKNIEENLARITGQKPIKTRAKLSIAGFKLRENDHIGYKVTLRGQRMYDFLDRLITYVFPRLRDFQGMPTTGFDRHGNYSFGLKEQSVFPEVPYESAGKPWGMQITVNTTSMDDNGAKELLMQLGFPFAKK